MAATAVIALTPLEPTVTLGEPGPLPPVVVPTPLFLYIEVLDGCTSSYENTCINLRSGPDESYPVVMRLRNGIVLKVKATVSYNGRNWYQIEQDTQLHFPERIESEWYVASDVVHEFYDDGDHALTKDSATTTKYIVIDRSEQKLYAYKGESIFMEEAISTGLEFTPTPRGTFTIYKMTPSRYMQGPTAGLSDQYYDLPGVPWNLYFTYDGAVIHGAYWHEAFGRPYSHGCVNLPPQKARELYLWADIGTKVIVRD